MSDGGCSGLVAAAVGSRQAAAWPQQGAGAAPAAGTCVVVLEAVAGGLSPEAGGVCRGSTGPLGVRQMWPAPSPRWSLDPCLSLPLSTDSEPKEDPTDQQVLDPQVQRTLPASRRPQV